ncbi:hypothetical protein EJ08DRAFT_652313 [Tothia fuscella]|uniref:Large ribosomal subunit protein bL32m n=1 Tax=Tothia fuscella TaxID=1048955 RepID=A0A9P4NKD6_9PEZI|nr:hypothetical protein EJ08DRAFT_652313 [Tothia fuscella]
MALRISHMYPLIHLLHPTVRFIPQSFLSTPILRRILQPQIPALSFALPQHIFPGISDFLRELWDGLLKAVPKKKTSHMKKRHRQMAGKALKDVTALNKCSACGKVKRAHVLCPHCVAAVRYWMKDLGKRRVDPELEKNTGPNLAEHPLWKELKEVRRKKKEADARERRISNNSVDR